MTTLSNKTQIFIGDIVKVGGTSESPHYGKVKKFVLKVQLWTIINLILYITIKK